MPKPGKKTIWKNGYNENEFRMGESTRRVSFKSNRGQTYNNKDWRRGLKQHFEEEDIDMGIQGNVSRVNTKRFMKGGKRGNRSGSPVPGRMGKRRLLEGPINWYRILMPYGNKYEKQYILTTLLEKITPTPLIPIMWGTNGTVVTFYVDDFKTAEKLNNLDREIQLPDGFKLIIKVNNGAPHVDVNSALKDKMKLAMGKRYNAATKAMDLSRFHLDPELHDVFCALFKPLICSAVIDIISENIPELEALNLSDNRIQMLTHLKKINQKLPNLKILYIGNNKLRDITQLDDLNGLPLVDLVLDGNPLCDKFKDQATYISEVRKRFPKVMKLDGIDLPPPISFDIEEVTIPPSKQTFLCNGDGQEIVRQFLEQFYLIMDTENRQPLLQAYHENAMFSMTMAYAYGQIPNKSPLLNWYASDNRNLRRVTDPERRTRLLKYGHLQIVAFLQEMPLCKHDIQNFTVDLTIFTPQMLLVTFSGLFKELKTSQGSIMRYFFRSLVIIPSGNGFCIVNDELHISNATDEQKKEAFKAPPPEPVAPTPVSSPTTPVSSGPDDATKQQMIQAIMTESGMNLEWSQRCLQDTNWNFQQAGVAFMQAKTKGLIPPEAFVK